MIYTELSKHKNYFYQFFKLQKLVIDIVYICKFCAPSLKGTLHEIHLIFLFCLSISFKGTLREIRGGKYCHITNQNVNEKKSCFWNLGNVKMPNFQPKVSPDGLRFVHLMCPKPKNIFFSFTIIFLYTRFSYRHKLHLKSRAGPL